MFLLSLCKKLFSKKETVLSDEQSALMRLELALEASGLVDWDFDYVKNTANRSLRHDQFYGYKELLPTWNFDHFFHHVLPEYHDLVKKKFADIPVTGDISIEFEIRKVDGSLRWVSLQGKSHRDSQGKVVRVAGVLQDITSLKKSEEIFVLQNKNVNSLFEKSPEFFCVFNPLLCYEYVNPAHVKLFSGRNMTGLSAIEAQPELRNSVFIEDMKKILINGNTLIYKDSPAQIGEHLRYLDMIYAPRLNANGEVDGIYALGSDVTDKILALRSAENSAGLMKLITDKLPAFISYTDLQGRYIFMNQKYEDWFEKPISQMLGKTRDEITPKEYAIQSRTFQDEALKGKFSHHPGLLKKENGDHLDLDIDFISDIDPVTNLVRGMIAIGVDVTTQTKALQAAEMARKELFELFMQAPAPMCLLTGPDHIFTMANPLYTKLVQREVIGKSLAEVFEGEDITLYTQILDNVYQTGKPYILGQAPLDLVSDGKTTKIYISAGYHPYKDLEGKVTGVLVIIQDITEQVNSLIARDNFISIASHELKTPLTTLKLQMQMNMRMLEIEKSFTPEQLKDIFNRTHKQVNRLGRLVEDMLDGSRALAENLTMKFQTGNLSQMTHEIFQNYEGQFSAAGIKVTLNVEDNIEIRMDETRIEQVIVNLITNALRYAANKPVTAVLKRLDNEVVFSLEDHGIGIAPKNQELIFERFGRVDIGRDVSGLGLGLYISKKIIENHGGIITAVSELGKGSEFVIKLPMNFNG